MNPNRNPKSSYEKGLCLLLYAYLLSPLCHKLLLRVNTHAWERDGKRLKKRLFRGSSVSLSLFSLSLSLSLSLMRVYRDYKETLPPKKITVAFSFVCKKKSLILWAISYLFFSSKVTYTRGTHKYTQTVMLTHYLSLLAHKGLAAICHSRLVTSITTPPPRTGATSDRC